MDREFLGWSDACLPRAAAWLRDRYAQDDGCDMSGAVVAVPGARAGRRLLELLAEQCGDAALFPPQIVTAGALAELLHESGQPVASDLHATLARIAAMKAEREAMARVVPHPPADDDWPGWLALSRDLAQVHEDLSADGVTAARAAESAAASDDFAEHERWEAIAALQQAYERQLEAVGRIDAHAARLAAIEAGDCACDRDVVLVATADLNRATREMLAQAAQGGTRVTALVHAPAEEEAGFDELGCLRVEYWHDRPLAIDPAIVRVVDRPNDQAGEVLRAIGQGEGRLGAMYAADQITVGLGDETMGPMVQRALELAGLPARSAIGERIDRTPPAMLLAALAAYFEGRRCSDFASLLRHPDIDDFLRRSLGRAAEAPVRHWLSLFDRYLTDHLQRRITGDWLGDAGVQAALKRVHEAVDALGPADARGTAALPKWSEPIAAMLAKVYAGRLLHRYGEDAVMHHVLAAIGDLLREHAGLDASSDVLGPRVTLAHAIALLVDRLSQQPPAPPVGGPAAIELLGWLELQLDDAPALIVTGVNEGHVPRSVSADAFLPDRLRRTLGVLDNRRRYARDRYALEAILNSRPHVTLVTGRRDHEDNPLTPSRLLLACEGGELVERVVRFYAESGDGAAPMPALLKHGGRSAFLVPPPRLPAEPLTALRVTAFRDYIACPYRFYLKHICRLEEMDDRVVELDGAAFGVVAHDVLDRFAKSDAAESADAGVITRQLHADLEAVMRSRFGGKPPAAVVLQTQQLRDRLEAFARWQAEQTTQKWRIVREHAEQSASAELTIDGEPFTIRGRIDRIDEHPTLGYRLIDYKTADGGPSPEKSHRQSGQWVDLQLPLYRVLAAKRGVSGQVAVGYVQLPKDLSRVGWEPAPWSDDEMREAVQLAGQIVRKIRGGVFWPPGEAPQYPDGFGGICMDASLDRAAVIERVTRELIESRPQGRES